MTLTCYAEGRSSWGQLESIVLLESALGSGRGHGKASTLPVQWLVYTTWSNVYCHTKDASTTHCYDTALKDHRIAVLPDMCWTFCYIVSAPQTYTTSGYWSHSTTFSGILAKQVPRDRASLISLNLNAGHFQMLMAMVGVSEHCCNEYEAHTSRAEAKGSPRLGTQAAFLSWAWSALMSCKGQEATLVLLLAGRGLKEN